LLIGVGLFLHGCCSCIPIDTPVRVPPKPAVDDLPPLESLTRDGVTIPKTAQRFSFKAPVRGREPVVTSFRLQKRGYLVLYIWLENAVEPTTLFFPGGPERSKLSKGKIPPELGDEWVAAELTISAVDEFWGNIEFEFSGIGVGKRAVGSTGIYDVTFTPHEIGDDQPASWEFWSRHDFERSRILSYRQETAGGDRREALVGVLDGPCQPRRNESCEGEWDLRGEAGGRPLGRYRLAVKAWQYSTVEKDWIIEWSEDSLTVR
jgi:hypothetical protein